MKKIIMLILILSAFVAGICLTSMRPAKEIPVNGTLSAQDVADIKRIVKGDLRRKVLPNFSWRSFADMPTNAKNYFKYEILEIDTATSSTKAVGIVRLPGRKSTLDIVALYQISKSSGRWKLEMVLPMIPRRAAKSLEAFFLGMPRPPMSLTNILSPTLFAPALPLAALSPTLPARQMRRPPLSAWPPPPNALPQPMPFQALPPPTNFIPASSEAVRASLLLLQKERIESTSQLRINEVLTNRPAALLPTVTPMLPWTNTTNGEAP